MFSTPGDGIPENMFAGFLGPAEATAIARVARESTLAQKQVHGLSLGGRRRRKGYGTGRTVGSREPRRCFFAAIHPIATARYVALELSLIDRYR